MRIGIDMQATLGPMTGLGVYAAGLWQALRTRCPEHDFVPLRWGDSDRWPLPAELAREQCLLPGSALRHHLDVIHSTGFPGPVWGRQMRVMTVHDLSVLDRPELIPSHSSRWYWSQWLAFAAQRADLLITPSHFTANRLVQRLKIPARRIVTLPYPPRTDFAPASLQDQLALRSYLHIDGPFILGVGAIEPRKDWEGLLTAFSRVVRHVPHRLVLVGPVHIPASQQHLEKCLDRFGLRQRVQFLGYVPLRWLPVLYSAADLLVFPETYAGYGLPVLEAMACGLPVLTYDNTALNETAAGAALLLPPPFSTDVLAEMMLHLIQNDALRAEMSVRGLTRVRWLSWDATIDCLSSIYAAAEHGRTSSREGAQPVHGATRESRI